MTTTIVITTSEGDKHSNWTQTVGDVAQKHVLRTFNPSGDAKVDATKVLCAAIIQQMIDLRDAPDAKPETKRAASIPRSPRPKVCRCRRSRRISCRRRPWRSTCRR